MERNTHNSPAAPHKPQKAAKRRKKHTIKHTRKVQRGLPCEAAAHYKPHNALRAAGMRRHLQGHRHRRRGRSGRLGSAGLGSVAVPKNR